MRMKLTINIGKRDAARLGLDRTKEGDEVDVDAKVAAELTKKGWAVDAGTGAPIQGVPAAPLLSSSQLPAGPGAVRPSEVVAPDRDAPDVAPTTAHALTQAHAPADPKKPAKPAK